MTEQDLADRDRRVGELAARLGEEFTLGPRVRTIRGWQFPPVWLAGCLLLCADVLGFLLVLISAHRPYSAGKTLAVIAAVAGVGLLGGFLIHHAGPLPVEYVFWYELGLVQQLPDRSPPTVLRWAEITTVTARISTAGEVPPQYPTDRLIFATAEATALTLGARYERRGLTFAYADYDRLQAPQRVVPLIGAYDRGETVCFGDFWINHEGASRNTRVQQPPFPLFWQDVTRVVLSGPNPGDELRIHRAGGGWPGGTRIALSGRTNAVLIRHLLQHVADRTGFQLQDRTYQPGYRAGRR